MPWQLIDFSSSYGPNYSHLLQLLAFLHNLIPFYWIRISIVTFLSLIFFLTKIKVAVEKLKNLENKFTQTFECVLPNDHPCIQSSIQKSNGRHVLDFVEILSSFFKPMFECSWHPSNLQFLKCADKLQSIWNHLQLVAICNL